MKLPSKPLLMLLLCLSTAAGYAQQTTPSRTTLFARFPQKIEVATDVFKNAFTATEGSNVSLSLGAGLVFNGIVLSNERKYGNLQNIVIRSAEYNNSLFSISKITNADNSISYVGRILNNNAADGYEIKKAADSYSLQKFETGRILQDCHYN
jgi:hypothetical protein